VDEDTAGRSTVCPEELGQVRLILRVVLIFLNILFYYTSKYILYLVIYFFCSKLLVVVAFLDAWFLDICYVHLHGKIFKFRKIKNLYNNQNDGELSVELCLARGMCAVRIICGVVCERSTEWRARPSRWEDVRARKTTVVATTWALTLTTSTDLAPPAQD
jgi:hypothetical protein